MRIVVTVRDRKFQFQIDSFDNVDFVEVVTPRGKSLYFNNAPKDVCIPSKSWFSARRRSSFTIVPNAAGQGRIWSCAPPASKDIDTKLDFIHYLMYSTDGDDAYPLDLDAAGHPLWKCVKWKTFKNDKQFDNDSLVYNFVNDTFIRFTAQNPVRFHVDGKWTYTNDQTSHNCKPLVQIRQALTTKIIRADGGIFEGATATMSIASAPPSYDALPPEPVMTPRTYAALRIFV